MTPNELTAHMNNTFGLNQWPTWMNVDANTYAQVCNFLFEHLHQQHLGHAIVSLGPNSGIMFKGVELLLEME